MLGGVEHKKGRIFRAMLGEVGRPKSLEGDDSLEHASGRKRTSPETESPPEGQTQTNRARFSDDACAQGKLPQNIVDVSDVFIQFGSYFVL